MIGGPRAVLAQETMKPTSVGATLRRLAVYFKPFWGILIAAFLLLVANTWVQVITPELLGQAVDCYMTPAVTGSGGAAEAAVAACWFDSIAVGASTDVLMAGLVRLVLLLAGIYVMGAVMGGLMFFMMTWAGQRVLRRLQVAIFHRLQALSLGYFTRHESGDLMSRITNDMSTLQQAISFALIQVLSGGLLIVWLAVTMVSINWAYGLLSLSAVPLMIVTTLWFSGQARKAFRKTRQEIGNVNAELEEGISGVREVQAFSREDANIENFRQSNAANRDANVRAVAYTSALAPTLEALGYVALAVVAGVGGIYLLQGQALGGAVVTLGLIVAFLNFSQRFNQPIMQISVLWANLQSAVAGAERIFELLDEEPDIQERPDARPMPPVVGKVEYSDVWAEYKPGEPVLQGIDLVAEPGQTIAVVGPTGAGKTTLVNLLPRFWDVTGGSVTIDGVDVRDVTFESLRSQMGLVLQDTFLFSDTVMDNIRFGCPEATDEEVIAAAKLARAHDFIMRLPDGYATVLGERGGGLSQGQRQLLAIARAAIIDPRILILDEATSSVDTRTERQIQAALEELLAGRTSFVIAHRLSTIRNADQVLVVVEGRIVERGRHEELIALGGEYHKLYMSQFARQEEMLNYRNGAQPESVAVGE